MLLLLKQNKNVVKFITSLSFIYIKVASYPITYTCHSSFSVSRDVHKLKAPDTNRMSPIEKFVIREPSGSLIFIKSTTYIMYIYRFLSISNFIDFRIFPHVYGYLLTLRAITTIFTTKG